MKPPCFPFRRAPAPGKTPSGKSPFLAGRGLSLLLLGASLIGVREAFAFDATHADWGSVLGRYLTAEGLVRYQPLRRDARSTPDHPFQRYVRALQGVPRSDFERWSESDKKAFLFNAYNALTVKLVIDNDPVPSIRKIGGLFRSPWKVDFFSLFGGKVTALDPIEHELLRPVYRDVRIHAALNCASLSCPPLRGEPYLGFRLEAQLDDQMRRWLADPTRNRYNPDEGVLSLSKIFDWYKDDFEMWGGGVKAVVRAFGPEEARNALRKGGKVKHLDYDWSLNAAR